MAVIAISTAPGRDLYDRVSAALDLEAQPQAGLVLHAAGETDDGQVRIVQVFDSLTDVEEFARTRMLPAFEKAGVRPDAGRAPEPFEAFELVIGS